MEYILEILDKLFGGYRWLFWICVGVIFVLCFFYRNRYYQFTDRVVSKSMNLIIKESNEASKMLSGAQKQINNMINSINNKK